MAYHSELINAFVFIFGLCIAASPAIWGLVADLPPHPTLIGRFGAFQNAISNLAGIAAPILTGVLVDVTGGFRLPLFVTGLIGCIGFDFFIDKVNDGIERVEVIRFHLIFFHV